LVITSNVNEIGKYQDQHPHANNYQLRFGLTSSSLGEHTLTVSEVVAWPYAVICTQLVAF